MKQLLVREWFPKLKQFENSKRSRALESVESDFEWDADAIGRIYQYYAGKFSFTGNHRDYAYIFASPLQFLPVVTRCLENRSDKIVFLSLDELEEWSRLHETHEELDSRYHWCRTTTWSVSAYPSKEFTDVFRENKEREKCLESKIPEGAKPLISMSKTELNTGSLSIEAKLWSINGETLFGPDFAGGISCSR